MPFLVAATFYYVLPWSKVSGPSRRRGRKSLGSKDMRSQHFVQCHGQIVQGNRETDIGQVVNTATEASRGTYEIPGRDAIPAT
jgi:hypothetical protein